MAGRRLKFGSTDGSSPMAAGRRFPQDFWDSFRRATTAGAVAATDATSYSSERAVGDLQRPLLLAEAGLPQEEPFGDAKRRNSRRGGAEWRESHSAPLRLTPAPLRESHSPPRWESHSGLSPKLRREMSPQRWLDDGPLVERRKKKQLEFAYASVPAFEAYSFHRKIECAHCTKPLTHSEAKFGTGLCHSCYDKCTKVCLICSCRLHLKQLIFNSGLCNKCFDDCEKECRMCKHKLALNQCHWQTGLCDECYKQAAKDCHFCNKKLERVQLRWGTGLCDDCYSGVSKNCKVCDSAFEAREYRWNSGLCNICYDKTDTKCKMCQAHIQLGSLRWKTGLCDGCYDKSDKICKKCQAVLQLDRLHYGTGLCDPCYDTCEKVCKMCPGGVQLDPESVHWNTGLCDNCYNTCLKECRRCTSKIEFGELHWGSGLCDTCYSDCEKTCLKCERPLPLGQLHWGTKICDLCFDDSDKVCNGCSQRLDLGQLHWGTGFCDTCYDAQHCATRRASVDFGLSAGVKASIAAQLVFYMAPAVLQPSLYLQIQDSKDGNSAPHVYALVLTTASIAAMVAPVPLGAWAHIRGEREVYYGVSILSAFGASMFSFSPNAPAFALAWGVLTFPPAIRGVRATYFAKNVPPEELSRVGQTATAAGLLGGFLGPIISTGTQWVCGDGSDGRWFDGFVAGSSIACLSCLVCAALLYWFMPRDMKIRANAGHGEIPDQCERCNTPLNEAERRYATALCDRCFDNYRGDNYSFGKYSKHLLIKFCIIAGLLEVSMNAGVIATFQPIAVGRFGWGSDSVALVTLAGAGLSVVISMSLSRMRLPERGQTVAAAALYFLGVLVYTIPPLSQWRMVLGFLLGLKAQILFMAPFTAIFSTLIGRWRVTNQLTTVLCLAPAIGAAIGTMSAPFFISVAGEFSFIAASLPAVVAVAGIAASWNDMAGPRMYGACSTES